jgi:hypothetical protein
MGRLGAALAAVAIAGAAAAQESASYRALVKEYRCPVVDRLERIHERASAFDHRDRFLAVTLVAHPHGYVQCMFIKSRTKMLCEASSGYWYDKPGAPRTFRLGADAVAALGRLGFSTDDSAGNFRIEFDVASEPDLNAIADFILRALHDGYGARADLTLRFNAPFAPRATTKCIPVS